MDLRPIALATLLLSVGGAPLVSADPLGVSGPGSAELGAGDGLGERLFPRRQRARLLGLEPATKPARARVDPEAWLAGRQAERAARRATRSNRDGGVPPAPEQRRISRPASPRD